MSNRPSWKKTRVPWEREISIWERMAMGENDSQIATWLETQGYSLDRETLTRVRQELKDIPEELAQLQSGPVRLFRRHLRGVAAPAKPGLPLMDQLALVEQIKVHWRELCGPLRSSQGLSVFAPGGREIQTWLLELNSPDWRVPGGVVHRDENDQLSLTLDLEQSAEYERLRQHLPTHPIWPAVNDYSRGTLQDLTARKDLLNFILGHLRDVLRVPVIREREQERPSIPYMHVNIVGILYELVLRRTSGLPWNTVVESDIRGGSEGDTSLTGLPLFFFFSKELTDKAILLLLQGPDSLAESSVARAAGDAYREAGQKSQVLNTVMSEVLNLAQPPSGSNCGRCRDWLDGLGGMS